MPRIAIASHHASDSVLLFSRVPLERIESVALDRSSRTSAALLRLVLRRRARAGSPDPRLVPSPPDLEAMLGACDAALLIGDRALFATRSHASLTRGLTILDLGTEWFTMTGLPFVFAFWAGPPRDDSPEIVACLHDSLEEGLQKVPEIARDASRGDPEVETLVRGYLTDSIHYRLGRAEILGLEAFYRMLAEDGLIPHAPTLAFHKTAACVRGGPPHR